MSDWISAKDKLPAKSGRYLVVHDTTRPATQNHAAIDTDNYDTHEKNWEFFRIGIHRQVTHWMHLPTLPSEVTDD